MLSLERSPVVRVKGFEKKIYATKNPDWVMGILEFASGTVAQVQTNWLLPDAAGIPLDDSLQVTGENGTALLAMQPAGLSIWSMDGYSGAGLRLRNENVRRCARRLAERAPVFLPLSSHGLASHRSHAL